MHGMIGGVVVPGMFLVFAMLGLLIGCVYLMSYIIARVEKKTNPETSQAESTPPPAAKAMPPAPVVQQPATLQSGSEVVAAISGAIACVMQSPYAITSITPAVAPASAVHSVQPGVPAVPERRRPVWGFAGMQQNNRPF